MGLKSMLMEMTIRKHPIDAYPLDQDFANEYDTLATKLGVACLTPKLSKLEPVLAKLSIEVYDGVKVERYMDAKGYWGWFPLRPTDRVPGSGIQRETKHDYPSMYGTLKRDVYNKPVPYPVLCTVDALVQELGSEIVFLVAALDEHPDPFLACHLRNGGKLYIIERWDEPSFR